MNVNTDHRDNYDRAIRIRGLEKHYPGFTLGPLDFDIGEGRIVGFIGRNGAGKTTTIKSMLGLVHSDRGSVEMLGYDAAKDEKKIKAAIGYAGGAVGWYKKKSIELLASVTASFYPSWDDAMWRRYTDMFSLDTRKTPEQLSEGMRVKLSLALALSHGARLLILDEPTSGLDPISREELLDVLLDLAGEGKTVFFSTHIVSDLEKCADDILFIRDGRIALDGELHDIERSYSIIDESTASPALRDAALGRRRERDGATLLVPSALASSELQAQTDTSAPSLEDIIIHLENGIESDNGGADTDSGNAAQTLSCEKEDIRAVKNSAAENAYAVTDGKKGGDR